MKKFDSNKDSKEQRFKQQLTHQAKFFFNSIRNSIFEDPYLGFKRVKPKEPCFIDYDDSSVADPGIIFKVLETGEERAYSIRIVKRDFFFLFKTKPLEWE